MQKHNPLPPKSGKDIENLKPGASAEDASAVGGAGDFGVRADDAIGREYTSRNTKQSDRGAAAPPRSGEAETEGQRVSGAGGNQSGVGASSGGDLDTDLIGVGTGGTGIAANPSKQHIDGPDDSDGSSREFASGGPAQGRNQTHVGKVGGDKRVKGTTHRPPDDASSGTDAQGSDAATPARRPDEVNPYGDGFAGEISGGEASGSDQAGR
jgi:hypothetical protein